MYLSHHLYCKIPVLRCQVTHEYIVNTTGAPRPSHGNEARLRANLELADLANFVPLVKYSLRLTFHFLHARRPSFNFNRSSRYTCPT